MLNNAQRIWDCDENNNDERTPQQLTAQHFSTVTGCFFFPYLVIKRCPETLGGTQFSPLPCLELQSISSSAYHIHPNPLSFVSSVSVCEASVFSDWWQVWSIVGQGRFGRQDVFKDDNKRTWFNVVNSHPLSHNPQDPMTLTLQAWLRLSGPCQTRHRLPTDCLLQFFIVVSKVCSSCSFCCSYHDIV